MSSNFLTPSKLHLYLISIKYPSISLSPTNGGFILPDNSQYIEGSTLKYNYAVDYKNIREERKIVNYDCELNINDLPIEIKASLDIITSFLKNKCMKEIGLNVI